MSNLLRNRRKELGLTLEEVGKFVGVGKSTVRKWETGYISNMGRDKIVLLAKALRMNPLDIIDPDGALKSNYIQKTEAAMRKLIPMRQQRVSDYAEYQLEDQNNESSREIVTGRETAAGDPINGNDQDGQAVTQRVNVADIPHGTDEIVTVAGHSMEPSFPKGSQIFVHWQPTIENGELAIVRVEDEGVTFKQIFIDHNKKCVTLHSLNPEYKDRKFNHNEISIIGKILK